MNDIVTDKIYAEIFVEEARERVFEALTNPADLAQWWGSDEMYRTFDWKLDLRPGGAWSCQARSADGSKSTVGGVYLEIDPPSVLAYTWNPSWDTIAETKVRFTLESAEGGTLVKVEHSGFAAGAVVEGHSEGWKRVLGWLASSVKHG